MDDDMILMRGGTEQDIEQYANQTNGHDLTPEDIEVAPGIYQSKEDYEANMAYDEMKDEQTIDELLG